LVRFDGLPLYVRVAGLPAAVAPRVRLAIGAVDLLAATVEVHYVGEALD
jgi:hypothetical protein